MHNTKILFSCCKGENVNTRLTKYAVCITLKKWNGFHIKIDKIRYNIKNKFNI